MKSILFLLNKLQFQLGLRGGFMNLVLAEGVDPIRSAAADFNHTGAQPLLCPFCWVTMEEGTPFTWADAGPDDSSIA